MIAQLSATFNDVRIDNGSPVYVGLHAVMGAATSDPNWMIYRIEGARVETQTGIWDNRASLSW